MRARSCQQPPGVVEEQHLGDVLGIEPGPAQGQAGYSGRRAWSLHSGMELGPELGETLGE
jgi:hypothetical protein